METRGIRNFNPANIQRGSNWLGLAPNQLDKRFCTFSAFEYGIRAFFVLMRTYHYKYKLNTIRQILHRFAPLQENNTYAYIAHVCKGLNESLGYEYNIDGDTIVNAWFNPKEPKYLLREFAKQVFKIESRFDVSDELLEKSINLI